MHVKWNSNGSIIGFDLFSHLFQFEYGDLKRYSIC